MNVKARVKQISSPERDIVSTFVIRIYFGIRHSDFVI
jgi:hypothetical protein